MAGENKKQVNLVVRQRLAKATLKAKEAKGEKRYLVYLKKMARFIPRQLKNVSSEFSNCVALIKDSKNDFIDGKNRLNGIGKFYRLSKLKA